MCYSILISYWIRFHWIKPQSRNTTQGKWNYLNLTASLDTPFFFYESQITRNFIKCMLGVLRIVPIVPIVCNFWNMTNFNSKLFPVIGVLRILACNPSNKGTTKSYNAQSWERHTLQPVALISFYILKVSGSKSV